MSQLWPRITDLERRRYALGDGFASLERRATTLEQALWQRRSQVGAAGYPTQGVAVVVKDCSGVGRAGVRVDLMAGGIIYATDVTGSNGSTSPPYASFSVVYPGTYDVIARAPNGRFVDTTASVTVDPGDVPALTIHLDPAAGYACLPFSACPDPVRTTLSGTSSAFGSFTLTYTEPLTAPWGAVYGGWVWGDLVDFPGLGACAAKTGANQPWYSYRFTGPNLSGRYSSDPFTNCPDAGASGGSPDYTLNSSETDYSITGFTCPASGFSASLVSNGPFPYKWFGYGDDVVTITE